jgi:hypothetical protein
VQINLNTYSRLLLIGHFSSKRGNLVGLSPATMGGVSGTLRVTVGRIIIITSTQLNVLFWLSSSY